MSLKEARSNPRFCDISDKMNAFAAIGSDSPAIINSLKNRGYQVVSVPRFSLLSFPVSRHADMLFCRIGSTVFSSAAYANEALDLFNAFKFVGYDVVLDIANDFSSYPNEARFNVLFCGGKLYGNRKAVSSEILSFAENSGIPFVHVNQGYAACNAAVCGKGIITSDPSLYSALTKTSVPCLRISGGSIVLDGYDHGFIGGASGYSPLDNTLYFCGDISLHPDSSAVFDFAKEMNVEIVSLCDSPLVDIGGIVFF